GRLPHRRYPWGPNPLTRGGHLVEDVAKFVADRCMTNKVIREDKLHGRIHL
ncbi:hypothetical protein PISMIDRAFT_690884, partial [Pisolithus microcarpus 441]